MARPEPIRLGPFVGGLNTASDATTIQDNDLAVCDNFELDLDGALTSRQPLVDTGVDMPLQSGYQEAGMRMLGFYTSKEGAQYLIASDGVNRTYYFTGSSWETISTSLAATDFVQYRDKAWLLAGVGSNQTGGSWSPDGSFAEIPGMPEGETIAVNKERLWVGPGPGAINDGARLTYSQVGEPNRWPDTSPSGGGYLSVNGGDGQNIVKVVVYFSDIVIFKSNSTYRFTFGTDPAQGNLTRLSGTVGASGIHCVVAYEADLYILYNDLIYLLSNYNFTRANIKTPLIAKTPTMSLATPFSLSIWNDRLIASFHDTTFVQNLRTKAWNTWSSDRIDPIGRLIQIPSSPGADRIAYVQSSNFQSKRLFKISSATTSDSEEFVCKIQTKNYDYQTSHTFKKLAQWGVDLAAQTKVTGKVNPIVFNVAVTWGDVAQHKWEDLGPWSNLLGSSTSVVDPVTIEGSSSERKYVRFLNTLRFRQVNFELEFETKGDVSTAPVKLFSITTIVGAKERAPNKIN